MPAELDQIEIPIIRPLWLTVTQEPVTILKEAGELLIAGLADGTLMTIDRASGEKVGEVPAHAMGLLSLDAEADFIATSGEDNTLKIWKLKSLELIYTWKAKGWIEKLQFIGNQLYFIQGKSFYALDFQSGDQLALGAKSKLEPRNLTTWENSISDFAMKNETEIALCGYSRLSIYDLGSETNSLDEIRTFNWKGQLFKLNFSPNERFAVCASNDLSIHIWDLKRDKDLSMRGFGSKIRDLNFRYDGLYMANCSGPEVIIWDYMNPGPANKKPQVLGPLEKDIHFSRYQHNGKTLPSAGDDGVFVFWRPDILDDKPIAIAGIRDQAVTAMIWTRDDKQVVTGLRTGYVALYPAPEVKEV